MLPRSAVPIRRDVIRLMAEHRDELAREHRVKTLSLFGSMGRDEAGPASDVDVLVDFRPGASLFTVAGLQLYLEELLGRGVDVVSRGGIKRQLRERILGEEVPVLDTAADGSLVVVAHNGGPGGAADQRPRGGSMAERDWKMRIEDMLEAIEAIQRYTAGMELNSFVADLLTVDAVAWNFSIIGEAERQVPPEVEARYPSVPWARMRAMRNELLHDYPTMRLEIVWETARDHLLPLIPVLREIFDREA